MASARTLAWVERLAWILIYGGLFAMILGVVTGGVHAVAGWSLGTLGGIALTGGVVLIWVRSRLGEPVSPDAQSKASAERKQ